jgi:hypothetical protein
MSIGCDGLGHHVAARLARPEIAHDLEHTVERLWTFVGRHSRGYVDAAVRATKSLASKQCVPALVRVAAHSPLADPTWRQRLVAHDPKPTEGGPIAKRFFASFAPVQHTPSGFFRLSDHLRLQKLAEDRAAGTTPNALSQLSYPWR